MEIRVFWEWLNNFIQLLEEFTTSYEGMLKEGKAVDPKGLAEMRIAERVFNFFLDSFSDELWKQEELPVNAYLRKEFGDNSPDLWNDIKNRRDNVANRISSLLESDKAILSRYNDYCERLKEHRGLGSLL